jgi:hypothetical protein
MGGQRHRTCINVVSRGPDFLYKNGVILFTVSALFSASFLFSSFSFLPLMHEQKFDGLGMQVKSEEDGSILLECKVYVDDIYQRQQGIPSSYCNS